MGCPTKHRFEQEAATELRNERQTEENTKEKKNHYYGTFKRSDNKHAALNRLEQHFYLPLRDAGGCTESAFKTGAICYLFPDKILPSPYNPVVSL